MSDQGLIEKKPMKSETDFAHFVYLADMGGPTAVDKILAENREIFSAQQVAELYEKAHLSLHYYNLMIATSMPSEAKQRADFFRAAQEEKLLADQYHEKANPQPQTAPTTPAQ